MKRALGYLNSVYQYLQSTRVRWTFVVPAVALVLVVFSIGLVPEPVYALPGLDDIVGWVVHAISFVIFHIATLLIKITVWALKFFIVLAGYNGFSTAPIVELGWTLVRDVANMFFIVAMLVIAFATILGREDYALKKTLGKLILMAILINFSKLIAQVVIDAAHVVTMTFLNALSAVAGGNLIQMFKFSEMQTMLSPDTSDAGFLESINLQLLGASILTLIMTSVALAMIGVYFIIMLYRIVTLWVLIIFSPIAYAAAALPATASVSRDWWSRFTKNVVSAPMMVFFMWLAFATIGNGAVLSQITSDNSLPNTETSSFTEESAGIGGGGGTEALSPSAATTWESMAGFAVAIAFLFAGIERVQALGVEGAGGLSKAKDIGMKGALGASALLSGAYFAKKGGKRMYKTAKARASIAGSRITQWRDDKLNTGIKAVNERQKAGKSTFGLGWAAKGGMSMLQSGRFKDRKVDAWEKAAENQKKIYESAISTGSTKAGKEKLDTTILLAEHEKRDEEAFAKKKEDRRGELLDAAIEKKGTRKEKKFGAKILEQDDQAYRFASEAEEKAGKNQDIIAKHTRKESPRFEAAARVKLSEERGKQFAGKSYKAMVANAGNLKEKIDEARASENEEDLKNYQSQLRGLTQVAADRDPNLALDVMRELGIDMNTQDPTKMKEQLESVYGDENTTVSMLASSFQKAGAAGAVVLPALVKEDVDSDGVSTFAWQDDKEKYKETQDAYASAYINATKLTDLGAIISNPDAQLNNQDAKNIVSVFKSAIGNMRIAGKIKDQFKQVMEKSSEAVRSQVLAGLTQENLQALGYEKPTGVEGGADSPPGGAASTTTAPNTTAAARSSAPQQPTPSYDARVASLEQELEQKKKKIERLQNANRGVAPNSIKSQNQRDIDALEQEVAQIDAVFKKTAALNRKIEKAEQQLSKFMDSGIDNAEQLKNLNDAIEQAKKELDDHTSSI